MIGAEAEMERACYLSDDVLGLLEYIFAGDTIVVNYHTARLTNASFWAIVMICQEFLLGALWLKF